MNLAGVKRLALDVETCDPQLKQLGPGVRRGAYIVGIAIATDDGRRAYYPIRHQGGGNLSESAVLGWARSELNDFSGEVVGAGILYDLDFLAQENVLLPRVQRFLDVQNAEPLLDENRLSYALEALSKSYEGTGKDEKVLRDAARAWGIDPKKDLWRLPAQFVGEYAEADVTLPLSIISKQLTRLAEEDLLELFDLESRLIPLLLTMRRRGVRVDVPRAEQVRVQLVRSRDEALAQARHIAGAQVELMAPDSFVQALLDQGLTPPRTAKTDRWSITKPWLEQHAENKLVQCILKGRRMETIINTFIDGHIGNHTINGRIHCQFHQLKGDEEGTIARFSSSNPNLQNIPSRDPELMSLVRGLFLPEEDEVWDRFDYSQIEYRFLVHFAKGVGVKEAREKYRQDPKTDFHKMCAEFIKFDTEDKVVRKKVKNTNFCKVYGGGVPKIAATAGITLQEAQEFNNIYDEKLPFVRTTLEDAARVAKQRGYIRTILKRRQRFVLWEPARNGRNVAPLPFEQAQLEWPDVPLVRSMTYAALNRALQGSAADLIKKAMVDIMESGVMAVCGAPLLTVHDELDVSRPRTKAGEEAAREIKRLMEMALTLKVPIIADWETGTNWAEAS